MKKKMVGPILYEERLKKLKRFYEKKTFKN
jgi:hypothetical protein